MSSRLIMHTKLLSSNNSTQLQPIKPYSHTTALSYNQLNIQKENPANDE